jgi:serine/threonine-protein kinase
MIGTTLSHYEILEKLGEGGMGVVYKAQDTTLDRLVALKFLPPHLSASEQDKARFVQEAKAAAALNHPNICTIYGIEENDAQMFIAMEFVEGQTLRAKTVVAIHESPLQIKQSIEIGIQIADGLAAAHEKGIVHRDVKPENIMIQKDGRVRIMDFGLAKLKSASRLTKVGVTVGTTGYMSPEQVQGLESDHRSDIFSLGVILYEMFAGQSPFKGAHETAINYEIVNVDPEPISAVKPEITPELDGIVLECMAKDVAERSQSAAEVAKDLRHAKRESTRAHASRVTSVRPVFRPSEPSEGLEPSEGFLRRKQLPWIVAGLSLFGMLALVVALWSPWSSPESAPIPTTRFTLNLPPTAPLASAVDAIAFSPDGKSLAYIGGNSNQIYLRRMDQLDGAPISGTSGSLGASFSPDGQWIAFWGNQQLMKISVFGGAPEKIYDVTGLVLGISWGVDDFIYYGIVNAGIFRISAKGGTPEAMTTLDSASGELSHRFPQLAPDGKTLIYTVKQNQITSFDEALIVAQRIGTNDRKVLQRGGVFGRYLPTGHLVFVRGGTIYAAAMDIDWLELKGPPVPVEEGGWMDPTSGSAAIAFSNNGSFAYAPSGSRSLDANLAWVDRNGRVELLPDSGRIYQQGRLSPDGQKLALRIAAANDDIWVYHIVRKTLTRLTFAGGNHSWPLWSPDGRYVYYAAEKGKFNEIFRKPWDGSGAEEQLTNGLSVEGITSISSDGKLAFFSENGDIWILPLDGQRIPRPFTQSRAIEYGPQLSPDGRWLTYGSNESGEYEIYVVPFPKQDGKWQVSTGGGFNPEWSRNGKELFYFKGTAVMLVDIIGQSSFDFSHPRKLFDVLPSTGIMDVSPDGRRFLGLVSRTQDFSLPKINIVLGWFDEVKRKLSGAKN